MSITFAMTHLTPNTGFTAHFGLFLTRFRDQPTDRGFGSAGGIWDVVYGVESYQSMSAMTFREPYYR